VLKLRCNKRSAYTERPTPPLVGGPISEHVHVQERTIPCSWISRKLNPGMTVLAETSSDLTDRPTDRPTDSPTPTKPQQSDNNKSLIFGARSGLIRRFAGELTVVRNLTSTLTLIYIQSRLGGHELPSCVRCARDSSQAGPEQCWEPLPGNVW
jgi:hypothetical protein